MQWCTFKLEKKFKKSFIIIELMKIEIKSIQEKKIKNISYHKILWIYITFMFKQQFNDVGMSMPNSYMQRSTKKMGMKFISLRDLNGKTIDYHTAQLLILRLSSYSS